LHYQAHTDLAAAPKRQRTNSVSWGQSPSPFPHCASVQQNYNATVLA